MSATDTTVKAPLLELHPKLDLNGEVDGSIAIRWCSSEELNQRLVDEGATHPYLVVSVRPYTEMRGEKTYSPDTKRYLFPLVQEMGYVSFSRPGLNAVTACVVYGTKDESRFGLGWVFLAGGRGGYDEEIYHYGGKGLRSGPHSRGSGKLETEAVILADVQDEFTVDVPDNMFAKPYPKWVTDFLGKFYRSKAFDQCSIKWRLILFGWWFFPLWLVLGYATRVAQLALGAWLGLRDMGFRSFLHPLRYGIIDVLDGCQESFWLDDKKGKSRPLWRKVLNPVTPVIFGLIIFVISSWHITRNEQVVSLIGWSWWQCLGVAVLAHLGLVAAALLIIGAFMGIAGLFSFLGNNKLSMKITSVLRRKKDSRKLTRRERDAKRKKEDLAKLKRSLDDMVCSPGKSTEAVYKALPKEKKTFALFLSDHKSRSCKPFPK